MRRLAMGVLAVLGAAALGGWLAVGAAEYRAGARAFTVAVAPYVLAAAGKERA